MGKSMLQSLFLAYLRLLRRTVQVEWAEDQVDPGRQIFGFWHEDSFSMNLVLGQMAERTRPVHVIVTADTRGDYIEKMLESCGGHALRVADGRASFGKLREILEEYRHKDASVAVALDGPRPPASAQEAGLLPCGDTGTGLYRLYDPVFCLPPSPVEVGSVRHSSALFKGNSLGPRLRQGHQEGDACSSCGAAEGKSGLSVRKGK